MSKRMCSVLSYKSKCSVLTMLTKKGPSLGHQDTGLVPLLFRARTPQHHGGLLHAHCKAEARLRGWPAEELLTNQRHPVMPDRQL